ncbi:MAG TPA: hypothetical protein VMW27_14345 [Thermoanaerobaculia bacterium]|nr:hypothetical protein [Thermoanaerobaculia bacterium]
MRPMIRLIALVLVILASATTLPSAAQTVQPLLPKTCAQLCAIVLCLFPQTCGPYVDSTGTPRCGCHDRTVS